MKKGRKCEKSSKKLMNEHVFLIKKMTKQLEPLKYQAETYDVLKNNMEKTNSSSLLFHFVTIYWKQLKVFFVLVKETSTMFLFSGAIGLWCKVNLISCLIVLTVEAFNCCMTKAAQGGFFLLKRCLTTCYLLMAL